MLLAWRSKETYDICASVDGIDRLWPSHSTAAKDLLSVLVAAPELESLRPLRSIAIRPTIDQRLAIASFSIHLEEVEMTGVVLDETGKRVAVERETAFWTAVRGLNSAEVVTLSAAGLVLGSAALG